MVLPRSGAGASSRLNWGGTAYRSEGAMGGGAAESAWGPVDTRRGICERGLPPCLVPCAR